VPSPPRPAAPSNVLPGVSLADTERAMIFAAIEQQGGSRTKAADVLGISRRTLHRKLKQYEEEDNGGIPHDQAHRPLETT